MWSKGAVVIVKYGDEDMANSMANSIKINLSEIPASGSKDIKTLETENYFLRCCVNRLTKDKIRSAKDNYNYNTYMPTWMKKVSECIAFIVYIFSTFVEKITGKQQ